MTSDRGWMEQVLALAALGEGTTHPNPRVGSMVVRDGLVVGWGFHRAAGEEHAEAGAIRRAGDRCVGATLYVNLEPCAHHGRTPPCVDRVVASGIRRVVASIQDPNPRVDGRGFRHLRDAGIEVEVGLLADEAGELNAGFLAWHRDRRPAVTLKAAATVDGQLAFRDGRSQWITGPEARRFAHRLRMRHDAIVVGAETVRRDDPRLDVRLHGVGVDGPRRIVLSRELDLDPGARVFAGPGPRTRIYTIEGAAPTRVRELSSVAEVVPLPPGGDGVDLHAVVEHLGSSGVHSVLVEGGGKTLAAFANAGLARRVAVFRGGLLAGARGATPMLDCATVTGPDDGLRVVASRRLALGLDTVTLCAIAPQGGEG